MALKKTLLATAVASAAGAATVLLRNGETRERAGRAVRDTYAKITRQMGNDNKKENQLKIGHPHPYDYEDNKMVNEGALTSVQHYNEKQQS